MIMNIYYKLLTICITLKILVSFCLLVIVITVVYQFQLKCYVDASSYLIHSDSKSHTGYTLSFGDTGTFFSRSLKQSLVATSSTHAEMKGLYSLVQDIIPLIIIISYALYIIYP
jgi:hypothetical protein